MTKLKKLYLLLDTSTGLEAVARDTKFLRTLESSTTEIHEGYFVTKEQLFDALYEAKYNEDCKDISDILKELGVE